MIYAYGIEENRFIWNILTIHSAIPFLFCELKARLKKEMLTFFERKWKILHFELKSSGFLMRIVCWLTNYFVSLFTLHYWRRFVFIDCKVQSSKLQNTLSSKRAWMALRNIKHGLHKPEIKFTHSVHTIFNRKITYHIVGNRMTYF